MDEIQFWELIDKSRATAGGDSEKQSDLLAQDLAQWPITDMFDFEDIFRSLRNKSYVAELWDAAFVIQCGCGDYGFYSFQEWLIGQGKDIFEKALADPESLIEVIEVGEVGYQKIYPILLGVVDKAYGLAAGQERPPRFWDRQPLKGELLGEPENLARFPKLKAKYWDWWMDHFGNKSADG